MRGGLECEDKMLNVRPIVSCLIVLMIQARVSSQTTFTLGQNFTTANIVRTPDSMGAIGIDYFVELVNGRYAVYRKSDHATIVSSSTGPVIDTDPRIIYDHGSGHWFASAFV